MSDYFYNITKIEARLWDKEHIGVTISNLKLGLYLEEKKADESKCISQYHFSIC